MASLVRTVTQNVPQSAACKRQQQRGVAAGAARRQWQPSHPQQRRHLLIARAQELEEIDPITGEVIAGTAMATEAGQRVEAGGLTFAYRKIDADPAAAAPGKLPVLCLHGLGSSSYTFRATGSLLAAAGHDVIAVDWPGHGGSSKPTSGFAYSADAYIAALNQFVAAVGLAGQQFAVIVHGYVLGQYGLLWALDNDESVAKLIILNTPLGLKTALRPELAAYKNPVPFLRPKAGSRFAADLYNAAGGPYAMSRRDADAYQAPYDADPAASAAIAATMDKLDWPALLRRVDEGYCSWRQPSLLLFGTSDQFIELKTVFEWLESKRTCMRVAAGVEAKLGHAPQEDYPEAINKALLKFLEEDPEFITALIVCSRMRACDNGHRWHNEDNCCVRTSQPCGDGFEWRQNESCCRKSQPVKADHQCGEGKRWHDEDECCVPTAQPCGDGFNWSGNEGCCRKSRAGKTHRKEGGNTQSGGKQGGADEKKGYGKHGDAQKPAGDGKQGAFQH
ncbi:hydrolase or acyltransferase of alpha beta superfamily isoform A [Chlorella sorokiniana]|uniref:Hydrolase or acyltransferase of alpha beta superfamily isoform A n=1 Tax=Chlorella sorokiniana TaxID=3076 RepID=A0A2P6TQH2_CHLSO|nr:hydrolase or acyltransferase of alpha beta superfamily isoform A [Chlorella sorokiniana]|eukprot:PRW56273.1 hydrolase or acyltransferase of alpha beta superfamily isoform A [Chlorella sorokiniana]